MVEHAVYHDAHPTAVKFLDQGLEGGFIAEVRINLRVVLGVVFVHRGGLVDGRQVDAAHAQLLEIVELAGDARQVAAEKLAGFHRPVLSPGQHALGVQAVVAVAEAIRENLIPDGVLDPGRRLGHIGRVHPRHDKALTAAAWQMHLLGSDEAVLKVEPALLLSLQLEVVL